MKKYINRLLFGLTIFACVNYPANGQSVIPSGVAAFYPFSGNANDVSGSGNNGTPVNVQFVADRFGNPSSAAFFSGNNSYVALNTTRLNLNPEFSISVWVKLTPATLSGRIFSTSGYELTLGAGFVCMNSCRPAPLDTPTVKSLNRIAADSWAHVVGVWSGKSMSMYINGKLSAALPTSGMADYSRGWMPTIGVNSGAHAQDAYAGFVDDLRIFNRVLGANEVAELFKSESKPSSETPTIASENPASQAMPSAIVAAASKLSPATNLVMQTASGVCEVRVVDSKGVLVTKANGQYARIQVEDFAPSELAELLETKIAYSALTSFGQSRTRAVQSEEIENRLRQIWMTGDSLKAKVQTRLAIIDDMRAYNNEVAALRGSVRLVGQHSASAANANAKAADTEIAVENAADKVDKAAELRAYGISGARYASYQANKDMKAASLKHEAAQRQANTAAQQSEAANQLAASQQTKCQFYAARLASYGIPVSSSAPFYQIPPLSMRLEVDVERLPSKTK